jgi:NAD(P)-dependent dehydrogenase (short-subunit alcohol dehydrogenase family)
MKLFDINCLAGGIYLITGASSGIGKAAANLVAQCGGKVILSGRDSVRLENVRSRLLGNGHQISKINLNEIDNVTEWVKKLAEDNGPLSGVFHAAGMELVRPIRMIKQEQLNEVFSSSIFAAFGIAKALAQKGVMQDGGSLVLMSSVAGSSGQIGMTAYSAAKASIDGLVRSLAVELATKKIRINSIVAGAVNTEMHQRLTRGLDEIAIKNYQGTHLLGFGEPEDISNAVIFLLSAASRWITGTTMVVDGGYLAK